ncbi:MAG: GntR family transcriptional regulator [Desulfovermiculus sp.]|nr:GntR family transcriptional regulator [Desulfovermiculus sp.]
MWKKSKLDKYTLSEQIAKHLTDDILVSNIKCGSQLIETELQERFDVSRSPVREALLNLEKIGLVEIIPRKGAYVKKITKKDVKENFPVRSRLEGLAAREAYNNLDSETIFAMEKELQYMNEAVKSRDVKLYWKHHLFFHEYFINASQNHLLINLLYTLRMHRLWYQYAYKYYGEDLESSYLLHCKIIDMFKDNNTDLNELESFVTNHIEEAMEIFLFYLDEYDSKQKNNETYTDLSYKTKENQNAC